MKVLTLRHVPLFVTPWTVSPGFSVHGNFSRQEHWSGLPFSSPGDLPNPGIESRPPAWQADSLPAEPLLQWCPWGSAIQWGSKWEILMKKEILMENEILMEKGDLLTPLKSSLDKGLYNLVMLRVARASPILQDMAFSLPARVRPLVFRHATWLWWDTIIKAERAWSHHTAEWADQWNSKQNYRCHSADIFRDSEFGKSLMQSFW